MKLLIAGSRSITSERTVSSAISTALAYWGLTAADVEEVVSGNAKGVDHCGEVWAQRLGIKVRRFPANWGVYGKRAGFVRNQQMAEYMSPDGAYNSQGYCVVVWDGVSKGTKHMMETAERQGVRVFVTDGGCA